MKQDFDSLKEKLEQMTFPSLYLFKFIVKSDLKKIAQIESLFHSERAEIRLQESSKGAFVSISVKEVMLSAEEIIDIYVKSSKIDGVIAL
jgi:putative lipoic acid-binding regulatory protein